MSLIRTLRAATKQDRFDVAGIILIWIAFILVAVGQASLGVSAAAAAYFCATKGGHDQD